MIMKDFTDFDTFSGNAQIGTSSIINGSENGNVEPQPLTISGKSKNIANFEKYRSDMVKRKGKMSTSSKNMMYVMDTNSEDSDFKSFMTK